MVCNRATGVAAGHDVVMPSIPSTFMESDASVGMLLNRLMVIEEVFGRGCESPTEEGDQKKMET